MSQYEKTYELVVPEGGAEFELPFMHRGTISKFIVMQVDGVLGGFMADLYNSRRALSDVYGSSASSAGNPPNNPALYRILPTQTVAADADMAALHGVSYGFRNQDGSYSVPISRLYLRIAPAGLGAKVFQVSIGAVGPTI